jgi:hypothetical protein
MTPFRFVIGRPLRQMLHTGNVDVVDVDDVEGTNVGPKPICRPSVVVSITGLSCTVVVVVVV